MIIIYALKKSTHKLILNKKNTKNQYDLKLNHFIKSNYLKKIVAYVIIKIVLLLAFKIPKIN